MSKEAETALTQRRRIGGRRNMRVVLVCLCFVSIMGGLAFASVPLYRIFCQVTGYGGTTQRAAVDADVAVLDREITVRFDANTAPGLAWKFYPEQRSITLKLGEVARINYFAENRTQQPLTGSATFNVTPHALGAYFNKIECFCFTKTEVGPGEKLKMPVVFFVDPAVIDLEEADGVSTLTLSYTFFPSGPQSEPVAVEGRSGYNGG
jgi:cytochrome c oxidase assembly protein subunit 11